MVSFRVDAMVAYSAMAHYALPQTVPCRLRVLLPQCTLDEFRTGCLEQVRPRNLCPAIRTPISLGSLLGCCLGPQLVVGSLSSDLTSCAEIRPVSIVSAMTLRCTHTAACVLSFYLSHLASAMDLNCTSIAADIFTSPLSLL